jgi:hypothetical protein
MSVFFSGLSCVRKSQAISTKLGMEAQNPQQPQKRPNVCGCTQIISLLNTEQNCGWVDLNLASSPDLTCYTSSYVISVVETLMYSLMNLLYDTS